MIKNSANVQYNGRTRFRGSRSIFMRRFALSSC